MKRSSLAVSFILAAFLSVFFSCATNSMPVPGETAARRKNITVEYFSIAQGYEGTKNYTKAIEYYQLCLSDKNLRETAKYKIARCYALSKDWENARTSYEELLLRDKENTTLKLSLAYIYAMNGNTHDALMMYSKLSDENPADASILKNYIAVLVSDGKYELAEEKFSELKTRFPDDTSLSDIHKKISEGLSDMEPFEPSDSAK